MNPAPPAFLKSIAEHNRHCWISAILSWGGAFLAWLIFTAIYVGIVLLVETVRTGDVSMSRPPGWMIPVGCGVAVLMLVVASVDRWNRRFQPPPDRQIIGWHLFGDFLLLPARLTFAIWDYLGSKLKLTKWEADESWRLLQIISRLKRVPASSLGQEFGDPVLLPKILLALQLVGWIDSARGDEDWFYYVPSDKQPRLDEIGSPSIP